MIIAYLVGISTQFEGEDIEVRYRIYEDEQLLIKESVMVEYQKPAVVGQIALIKLLRKLKKYIRTEILVIVNDAALSEIVRGTSTTQNRDVLNMSRIMRKELNKFENVVVKDISGDYSELTKWNEILKP